MHPGKMVEQTLLPSRRKSLLVPVRVSINCKITSASFQLSQIKKCFDFFVRNIKAIIPFLKDKAANSLSLVILELCSHKLPFNSFFKRYSGS